MLRSTPTTARLMSTPIPRTITTAHGWFEDGFLAKNPHPQGISLGPPGFEPGTDGL